MSIPAQYVERARHRANGDVILRPTPYPDPAAIRAELDSYFKSSTWPWECPACGCHFVPGDYRVVAWHIAAEHDAEAHAYCACCRVMLVRCRPLWVARAYRHRAAKEGSSDSASSVVPDRGEVADGGDGEGGPAGPRPPAEDADAGPGTSGVVHD